MTLINGKDRALADTGLSRCPLEALDVIADPVEECLKGRRGDKPLRRIANAGG
jgi:hypothetical protein